MGWTTEKDPRQGSLLSAWKGGATEEDWPKRPSECQLQEAGKDSDWAIAPVAKAACVPAHLAPPGSPQAKQPCQLSLGQSCHRQRKSCNYACRVTSVGPTLRPCRLWPASLLSGRGLSRQEYWSVLDKTGCHTLLKHSISCCLSHQLPWVPGAARTQATQAAAPPPLLALTGQTQVLQGSLRGKPQWTTHMQRWQ